MGMFDTIRCNMHLPVENNSEYQERTYQTKDLFCIASRYRINSDGQLVDECFRYQKKENAPERPSYIANYGKDYKQWLDKWVEPIIGPDRPIDFTGTLDFYDETIEFCAHLEKGIVYRIDFVSFKEPQDKPTITARFGQ